MDHNPFLKINKAAKDAADTAKGHIEVPGEVENIIWQTRPAPVTDYERRLGDALEACFKDGIKELGALVERLNEMGVLAPDGGRWTTESFERELGRLGD